MRFLIASFLLSEAPCNRQMLNASDSKEVAETHRRRNLLECLQGFEDCERSLLSPGEAAEVGKIDHQRPACEMGYDSCNHAWLAPSGAEALAALKIYYVREMIAALIIFAVLFAVVDIVVFAVFILDCVTQRTFAWVESCAERLAFRA